MRMSPSSSPTRFNIFEVGEGHFRLDHPEIRSGGGVFWISLRGSWAEANTLAERRRGGGFAIRLAGLREVDFSSSEVIEFEKSAGAFACGGREDRRVHQHETV